MFQRMAAYMLENNCLDAHVQKGGIPGFVGCFEHANVLTQLIKEAKDNKGELLVVSMGRFDKCIWLHTT